MFFLNFIPIREVISLGVKSYRIFHLPCSEPLGYCRYPSWDIKDTWLFASIRSYESQGTLATGLLTPARRLLLFFLNIEIFGLKLFHRYFPDRPAALLMLKNVPKTSHGRNRIQLYYTTCIESTLKHHARRC